VVFGGGSKQRRNKLLDARNGASRKMGHLGRRVGNASHVCRTAISCIDDARELSEIAATKHALLPCCSCLRQM
jgi:hypothetical protein